MYSTEPEARPVRVGVVGQGYWGRKLVERYRQVDGALVVGICDHDAGALARASAENAQVPAYSRLEDLLRQKPDLVVVATEPLAHMPVARAALEAGCAVFVEKPLATSVADADALAALAARVGRPVLGSALWSWDPVVGALARLVAQGRLGRLLRIEGARQNLGCLKPGHDVLDDLLPHDLQIMRRLMSSPPIQVQAWGSRLAGTSALDAATVRLRWSDATEAELRLSWVSPEKVRRMVLVGTLGMAVLEPLDVASPLRIHHTRPADAARAEPGALADVWAPALPRHGVEPLLAQCIETLSCVRGATPSVPLALHREVTAVVEAARRSADQQGAPVRVAPALSQSVGVPTE